MLICSFGLGLFTFIDDLFQMGQKVRISLLMPLVVVNYDLIEDFVGFGEHLFPLMYASEFGLQFGDRAEELLPAVVTGDLLSSECFEVVEVHGECCLYNTISYNGFKVIRTAGAIS